MSLSTLTVCCPCCASPCPVSDSTEALECPTCGWEFAVEAGTITDDGGLDTDSPFERDDEGELTTELPGWVECAGCHRPFEVWEPGLVACPRCRRHVLVDMAVEPWLPPPTWPTEDDEEDEEDGPKVEGCPYCGN